MRCAMAEGQGAIGATQAGAAELRPMQIEMNGINVISDSERKGHPRDLFWPWFAANVSVLDLIMRMQSVITIVTAVLTVGFIILVIDKIHWSTVSAVPSGSGQALIGALVFMMTGFGLGWVNAAADYSRYLPRRSSGRGVIGWTAFGYI